MYEKTGLTAVVIIVVKFDYGNHDATLPMCGLLLQAQNITTATSHLSWDRRNSLLKNSKAHIKHIFKDTYMLSTIGILLQIAFLGTDIKKTPSLLNQYISRCA